MIHAPIRWALLLLFPCLAGSAQVISFPTSMDDAMDAMQTARMQMNFFQLGSRDPHTTEVQSPDSSVSRLDLKAPGKARHKYEQGYRLLVRKDLAGAIEQFTQAIAIDPKFVAAHNGLGTADLELGQYQQAVDEFNQAIALDGHLPNSYLNLGCAELALKRYASAEDSFRKATLLAPLDLQLKLALAYAEFANHDYPAVITIAREVHQGKHDGAAVIHFFAAGALQAQGNLAEAQQQMETLLQEDPKSSSVAQFRQILDEIRKEEAQQAAASLRPAAVQVLKAPAGPTPEQLAQRKQFALQMRNEEDQIAEAETAPDPTCVDCGAKVPSLPDPAPDSSTELGPPGKQPPGWILRISVNEISEFFTVTDHGRPITDLTAADVQILDNGKAPENVLGFRNEAELPLRLGLVIDTSDSIASRFSFEQDAATKFLRETTAGKDDLAFVVGVNNLVLLAQDFSADQDSAVRAVHQLAASGGTSLWDAVAFSADKLAGRPEVQPVARVLVVISDGNDNSSSVTLKQAIEHAQRDEVAVYTVSTHEMSDDDEALVGNHALQALADLTGGAAFVPDSLRELNGSLDELQQVIRSRYLVSYKPASFALDGTYRTIDLEAQQNGRPLKVFARKGYYASAPPNASPVP
jgi:Ca-activated chloride channel homolog